MMTRNKQFVAVVCALLLSAVSAVAQNDGSKSRIVERVIHSKNFEGNKIGVSADRKMVVYLPSGYDRASKCYPVLYFFPSPMDGYRTLFDKSGAQALFDRAITRGTIRSFILVSVDMTTPLGASWFVNSPVTGNWEDFVVQELVPYVDANFHTIPTRDARGLVGQQWELMAPSASA
jgi:enterochelin esterase-like enzyme